MRKNKPNVIKNINRIGGLNDIKKRGSGLMNTKQNIEMEARKKAEHDELNFFQNTKNNYFNCLSKLKNEPNNPELKQQTLSCGRRYSELTRNKQGIEGITIFDEIALLNDINAACAGAVSISAKAEVTVEERLAKLSELKKKDLISDQEYNERRQKILDEI